MQMVTTPNREERLLRPPQGGEWVVGVDGSAGAERALDWASMHAAGRATRLHLVRCVDMVALAGVDTLPLDLGSYDQTLIAQLRTDLEQRAEALESRSGVAADASIERRHPTEGLLVAAGERSLLVVGSRGRGGFARLLLGSTSQQCATHCTVPTVVVPESHQPSAAAVNVVVGIDGSANSLAALGWALEFAAPDSTVRAVSVWDPTPLAAGSEAFFFPEATDLALERFHHLVDQVESRTPRPDVTVEREFVCGAPRAALADESQRSDLLVVGARGHGSVGALLLGSVATWLLHHASPPVVIVPG